jgi:rod shape determining protein RodA
MPIPRLVRRLSATLTAHIDAQLLIAMLLLMGVSLLAIFSGSNQSFGRISNQLVNITVALTVMYIFAYVPPNFLLRIALPLYLSGVLLLICVALFGDIVNGARRWLHVGVTRIQPSELMKIAVPLMLAWYFDRYAATLKLKNYLIATALLMLPVALIVRQPDLGTAVLIFAAGGYVLFLAGLSWRIIIGLAVAGCASLPLLWSAMHDYQRQRILTLIDPTQDPLGAGYHTIQSTIAVGSGGFFGKGWLQGTQTHLDFIPERTTDFIFAVFAEEFGLLGNMVLLFLFLLVIGRGMVITANAPTLFTRLFGGALTLTFFTYAFVNMGMVSGILPVVGVPLPLVSYGGTSLVTICLGMGILMSIQTHKKLVQS